MRTGDIILSHEEEKETHTQNSQMVTEAQQQKSYVKKKKKNLLDPMLFAFSASPSPQVCVRASRTHRISYNVEYAKKTNFCS